MYIYTYVYVSACDKKRSGLGSLSNMPERIASEKLLVYTYTHTPDTPERLVVGDFVSRGIISRALRRKKKRRTKENKVKEF